MAKTPRSPGRLPAALAEFPCATCLPGCEADASIHDLLRLLTTDLTYSTYLDGPNARRLLATSLSTYRDCQQDERWKSDPWLARLGQGGQRFAMVLSAMFDYATNVEYCSTRLQRLTDSRWIYCNAAQNGEAGTAPGTRARVFYSFLKQCPLCCLRLGLGARIEGAQHKPPSHHIGEITGCLMGLLLDPALASADPPLKYGMVTKQSHNVDALAYSPALAVLFEIKASPLVTFPLAADLPEPMVREVDGIPAEYAQHQLVDVMHSTLPLYFFIPHRELTISLGTPTSSHWPYEPAIAFLASPDGLLTYLSAWAELYFAYAVPKTARTGRIANVAYLTNGWGDEIDSNKTKPGLGRTDDLKKGTYQLLKYGAYYKDRCARRVLYSGLLSNLDPVNLWAEYLERLLDVRWTKAQYVSEYETVYHVPKDRFYFLYEAIVAFNRPAINEPTLRQVFDFQRGHDALTSGRLNATMIDPWV